MGNQDKNYSKREQNEVSRRFLKNFSKFQTLEFSWSKHKYVF